MAESQPCFEITGVSVRFQRLPMQTTGPRLDTPPGPVGGVIIHMILKWIFGLGVLCEHFIHICLFYI